MPPSDTIEEKLILWLETQGYPLEMRVARVFLATGFRVVQSDYYVDPSTNDSREVDVVATAQTYVSSALLRIAFVIECKSSRDKPWILFTSNRIALALPATVAQRAASRSGHRVLSKLASETRVQQLQLFRISEEPGYGLTQAFTSGNDICYAAATSVAAAAMARVAEEEDVLARIGQPDVVEIVFPIIVTEARLFAASLNEDNSISVAERPSGMLLWRNPLVGMPHTIIQVATIGVLPKIVDEISHSVKEFFALCNGDLREPFDSAKNSFSGGLSKRK